MTDEERNKDFFGRELKVGDIVQYNTGNRGDNGYDFLIIRELVNTPKTSRAIVGTGSSEMKPNCARLMLLSEDMLDFVKKMLIKKELKG